MANYESHCLYGQELKKNLLNAGVLEELPDDSRASEIGNTHMLCFAKCSAEVWVKELAQILEKGVIDFSKKNIKGTYGVRRDYTPEEQENLGRWPVRFSADGTEMTWICKWVANDGPGYYASLAIPNQTMIYTQFYECKYDGGCYMRGGKVIARKPGIRADGLNTPKELLEAAIDALKMNKLEGFANEMVNRYMSVAEDGEVSREQKIAIVLDYVYCLSEERHNIDDAYTDEEKQIPDSPAMEPDPDLPF